MFREREVEIDAHIVIGRKRETWSELLRKLGRASNGACARARAVRVRRGCPIRALEAIRQR